MVFADFGTVDVRTANALAHFMDSVRTNKARWQARLGLREKKPFEYPTMAVSDYYPLIINIYAPRKLVPGIGKYFSQRQVYFKHPLSVDRGIEILNPHTAKV